jgi:hypothetical protein
LVASLTATPTPPDALPARLRAHGFAVLDQAGVATLLGGGVLPQLEALVPSWDDLAPDQYLRDGGHYRQRRHSCFVVTGDTVVQVPHRAHFQSLDYNALHGGMRRWFEPMRAQVVGQPVWPRLLVALGQVFSAVQPVPTWHVEAHQFRIDTTDGIGRPTPEGAHRDGVDFVAVFLVDRVGISGGETRVFDAHGPQGQRFTLQQPWSLLLLDDARVIHESTPIQPLQPDAHRDTLVLTYRASGFQGDD